MRNNSKGITLIALIITIIVLLILAGVALNAISGDDGILTKAEQAAEQWDEAIVNEQTELDKLSGMIEEIDWESEVNFGTNGNTTWAKSHSTTVTVENENYDASSLKYLWASEEENVTIDMINENGTSFESGATITNNGDETGTYYLYILVKSSSGKTGLAQSNAFNLCNAIGEVFVWGWSEYYPNVHFTRREGLTYTLYLYNYSDDTLDSTYDVTDPEWENSAELHKGSFYYILEDSLGHTQQADVAV